MSEQTDHQIEALKDLVRSEGWRLFMAHMEQSWGHAACETALRDSRQKCAPEEWPFESSRILDTFAGMRASVKWPEEQIKTLQSSKASRLVPDRFALLRRGPQPA